MFEKKIVFCSSCKQTVLKRKWDKHEKTCNDNKLKLPTTHKGGMRGGAKFQNQTRVKRYDSSQNYNNKDM